MKNMVIKKTITGVIAAVCTLVSSTISAVNAVDFHVHSNKSEAISTEAWTANYNVDGVSYPYMKCVATVYNDGCVTVNGYNIHKWDDTSKHLVTIPYTLPTTNNYHMYEDFKNHQSYYNENLDTYMTIDNYDYIDGLTIQNYPANYTMIINNSQVSTLKSPNITITNENTGESYNDNFGVVSYFGRLNYFDDSKILGYTFYINNGEFTNNTFNIFGHSINVNPEVINDENNVVDEFEVDEYFDEETNTYCPSRYIGPENENEEEVEYNISEINLNAFNITLNTNYNYVKDVDESPVDVPESTTITTNITTNNTTTTSSTTTINKDQRIAELEKELEEARQQNLELESKLNELEGKYNHLARSYVGLLDNHN